MPWKIVFVAAILVFASGCLRDDPMPNPAGNAPKTIQVTSSAFAAGGAIPSVHTCDGADRSPPLSFEGVPAGAATLALIMDDPDAPSGTFTHWTFWNLPKDRTTLAPGQSVTSLGAREGSTSFGDSGYGGPCPPSGTHRYFFKVYALGESLNLSAGASLSQLTAAMSGHVLAWGELMGTYARGG